ncbi:unnamed protein product [Phytophthora fragariaefolia]|uniref:Unnamed protein product n=1 Tax=Phytophthora fragariaefolia TaxID=1490495 RepID=A0A9W6Y680_9STRA|nr:unnamed protein product [Phytophthora fragariaefolia]
MTRKWLQLLDDAGRASTAATSVFVDIEDVDTFRKAVKKNFKDSLLEGISPTNLIVFANQAAYDAKQRLEDAFPIGLFGVSRKEALIVVLTASTALRLTAQASYPLS